MNAEAGANDGLSSAAATREANTSLIDVVDYQPSTPLKKRRWQWSPLRLFLWMLTIVLAIALWFVFSARSVWLQIDPTVDELELVGTGWRVQWQDHYLMRSGELTVRASKKGYVPLDETITITREASQLYAFTLVKLPGHITIYLPGNTGDATITLGEVGMLPGEEADIAAGTHTLTITSERYLPYREQLVVTGLGEAQRITPRLQPNWADVTVVTEPQSVQVLSGARQIATTPGPFELVAGQHQLVLRAPGFKDWTRTLNVTAGEALELEPVKLIPADGSIVIATEPSAAIAVNGRYHGMSPQTLKLPPGNSYTISASKVGFQKRSTEVRVYSSSDTQLDWVLQPMLGSITVVSRPAAAEIWQDGVRLGTTGTAISLAVRDHDLEIRAPGYAPGKLMVLPQPDVDQTLTITLLTVEQAREAELARLRRIKTTDGQELLLLRPRVFTMGSSRRSRGRQANEALREASLTQPYYLATKEVTNAQFSAFKAEHSSGSVFTASLEASDAPVVNVSWQEAAAYCNWLSERNQLPSAYISTNGRLRPVLPSTTGYRLPTEAEWAWAARFSGERTQSLLPWGEDRIPPKDFGNFADRSSEGLVNRFFKEYDDGHAATAPSGSFAADPAGFFDLAGNVSEWTQDRYLVGQYAPASSGRSFVIRGSSWQHSDITELRPTYRDFSAEPRPDLGFRIARYLD